MDRPQSPLICCLYLLLIASALGCAAQERRKYDRWFPPGSTREQMIAKYGQPAWIVDRPSANPSDAEWRTAIDPKKEWMHPSVFVEDIKEVERQTSAKVARFDVFAVPSHRSFLQRLDFFGTCVDLVYYDGSQRVISSKPLPYYAYGD